MTTEAPIGELSPETLQIEAYLGSKKHGDFITYQNFIEDIGIDVREHRSKFYTACKRLNRQVSTVRMCGYRLSSCATALPIVGNKQDRIISATKGMVRAVNNLEEHHEPDLTTSQKDVLSQSKYAGNAILGSARSAKKIVRREVAMITEATPHA